MSGSTRTREGDHSSLCSLLLRSHPSFFCRLKTRDRCLAEFEGSLCGDTGVSVAVDNTNRDIKTRAFYVATVQKLRQRAGTRPIRLRCLYFRRDKALTLHLNSFRNAVQRDDADKAPVASALISKFYKELEVPTVAEGFNEVVEVPFFVTTSDPR
jgi:hypothetical protein